MEKKTAGIVVSVKKQWWLKVNRKSFRVGMLDGASFPHIVKVRYTADGKELIKRKWLGAHIAPPSVNQKITVIYQSDHPTKLRLEI